MCSIIKNGSHLFISGLIIILAGCASAPDPHPFQQYGAAVKAAGDGIDHALIQDIAWSRDRYIESILEGSSTLRQTALLDRHAPYTVLFPVMDGATKQPTFYKLQDVRLTLLNLNEATEKYVSLIIKLAGSDLIDPAKFEALAKDSDASLNSITKQLDAHVSGNAIPLFSLAGSEILRLLTENKRHAALDKILTDSQPAIEGYSKKCLSLLLILDQSLANDYDAKADLLDEEFHKVSNGKPTDDPKARAVVEQYVQLDSDYLALIDSLKAAKKIYETLPAGHQELLKSIRKQPTTFEAISGLFEEGARLAKIGNELALPPSVKK